MICLNFNVYADCRELCCVLIGQVLCPQGYGYGRTRLMDKRCLERLLITSMQTLGYLTIHYVFMPAGEQVKTYQSSHATRDFEA